MRDGRIVAQNHIQYECLFTCLVVPGAVVEKNLLKENESVVSLGLKVTTGKRVAQLLPLSERIVRRCKV